MDSFEINKVAGAVLGTLLFAFGTGFLAELIYTPKPAGAAGYALPGGGGEGGEHGAAPAAGGEAAGGGDSIATRLASADAEKGKGGTKACQACHSFEKGGPNKMGPDLWEVVGRKKGSHEGFGYSDAMKTKGGDWSYDDLDHFLTKPGEYVKGTKMAFQGISSPTDRANVIAYLHTLSDSPKPLPAADKKDDGKTDAAKPAESDKKADAKPADAKPADKPADAKKDAAKPSDAKPADAKPAAEPEKKADEAKPADKPAEGDKKADEAKPAGDAKPADAKPAEQKPADEKPAQP